MMALNREDNMEDCNQTHQVVSRLISRDLLPVNEKEITEQWAKETYNHCHLFTTEVTGTVWESHQDLKKWMYVAKNLMKDIKCHGVEAGRERIVHLANHKYNLTLPSDQNGLINESLAPVNINDVVEIVSNPSWYNDNKYDKQNIIHDLIYAITRKTNNFWLITAEKKWMQKHNVTYGFKRSKRITESRGFVYKLMNSIFSNTTIRMFKRAMLSSLGEYISVRDNAKLLKKIQSGEDSEYSVTPRMFSGGKGYIIHSLKKSNNNGGSKGNQKYPKVKAWIEECVEKKMSFNSIVRLVKIYYQECLENYDSNLLSEDFNEESTVVLKQNFSHPIETVTNIKDWDFNKMDDKIHNDTLYNETNSTSGIHQRSAEIDQMLYSQKDDATLDDDELNDLSLPLFAVPELPICK